MGESKKKRQKKIYVILAIFTVLAIVFIGLGASGTLTNWVAKRQAEKNYEELIASASDVKDEMTLRQLLLLDEELEITVNKDMEIKTGFTVNGTKTLRGNAVISSNLGILNPIAILNVTANSKLTMDGLVLDGNGNAIGIQVRNQAELTYLSGKIIYAGTYGIATEGNVTIEDVIISDCTTAAIDAGFQSKVYLKGGKLVDNRHIAVYVEAQAYMEISEGAVIDGTAGQGIRNRGELLISGGEFKNIGKFVVTNHDKVTIDYKGSGDGYIKVSDIGSGVVYNSNTGTADVKDVYAVNLGTDAYKCVGGKMSVENCVVETVKTHGFYISYGDVSIKDVRVDKAGSCGIYILAPAVVTAENLELNDIGTRGIMSKGATVTGKNVTINRTGTYGVSNQVSSEGTTSTNEYTNLTVTDAGKNSVNNSGGSKMILTNAVLDESGRTNIYVGKGEVTLHNVEIKGTAANDCAAISVSSAGTCTMTGQSKIHGKGIRGVNISGIFNMQDGEIYGYKVEKQSGGAVRLYKDGVFNMSGGSIHDNTTKYGGGAVYLNADSTANMTGGKIYNNTARMTGGAVQVEINSVFNMKGGSIENNKTLEASGGAMYILGKAYMSNGTLAGNQSATVGGAINLYSKTDVYGEFHMTGGTIQGNSSTGNGGGVHISSGTTVTMSGGRITDNVSAGSGSGINQNGSFTMSGSAYVGNNTIALGDTKKVVTVAGKSLSAHSAQNPLLIEPSFGAEKGTVVARCESTAASANMLGSTVPGNKAYASFAQNAENIMIGSYNENIDMNMAGADTVHVTNFQQLKTAVESTSSKRYVVIGSSIKMEGTVTVPAGTTVYIRDDGAARVLSRKEGNTSSFFRTTFGTGLYIAGTRKGNLVLDGDQSKAQQLVIVRGATEISNVTFRNNNAEGVTGAFVRHLYGRLNIADSTFNGGYANAGGAIASSKGTVTITNSTFTGNGTKSGGGAIRVENGASVTVTASGFSGNTAGTVGGAINCDNGTLTAKDTTFAGNTSKGTSGAANLTNASTATITGSTFDGNQSTTDNAGAVRVNKSALVLENTTFADNKTPENGGAIFVEGKIDTNTYANVKATGCTFKANSADKTGGAIKGETGIVVTLKDTDFIQNQSAGTTGGAIDLYKSTVNATNSTFEGNEAKTSGGAIYLNKEATANLTECQFKENKSTTLGGAIYVVSDATANVVKGTFLKNQAGNEGGAIYTSGTLQSVSDVSFSNNTSTGSGGAVYVNTGAAANVTNSSFTENKTANEAGGAIYTKGVIVTDTCTFTSNSAKTRGGAVWINGNAASANISGSTFTKNTAGRTGGALEVNGGTAETVLVENCTFDNNSATTDGAAIYVRTGKAITISGGSFVNEGREVAFEGSSDMGQAIISGVITGAVVKYSQPNKAGLVIGKAGIAGSEITVTPKAYIEGDALLAKTEEASEDVLKEAAMTIKLTENADGKEWSIKEDGTLQAVEIQITYVARNEATQMQYTSLAEAVKEAKDSETIAVLCDMKLGEAISIADGKNLTITNESGKDVTLVRGFNGSLFDVKAGGMLTLGSADRGNTFVVDGGYNEGAEGSISAPALVKNAGTFNLLENATLQNAHTKGNSSSVSNDGGALYNTGTVSLAGNFTGNRGYNGGAVYNKNGTLNITGGVYSGNTGAGQGGAVYVASATDSAAIANAEMKQNVVSAVHDRGVAIYLQGGSTANEMTLENCNIHGNVVTGTSDTDPGSDIMLADNTTLHLKNNINVGVVHQRYGGTTYPYAVINVKENYTGAIVIIPNVNNCKAGETQLVNFDSQMLTEDKAATAGKVVVRAVTGKVNDDTTYCIDSTGMLRNTAAKVGNICYATFKEALGAAQSDDTVTVLRNVELDETVFISNKVLTIAAVDGKNVTFKRAEGFTAEMFYIAADGNFTIEGAITVNGGYDVSKDTGIVTETVSIVENSGKFTLGKNATLTGGNAGTSKNDEHIGGTLFNAIGAEAILYGNVSKNTAYKGGAVYNRGTLTIKGGTYENNESADNAAVLYNNGGTLVIEAGTFKNNTAKSAGAVIYSNDLKDVSKGTLKISGGTFEENTATSGTGGVVYCSSSVFEVTGGTFKNNKAVTGGGVMNIAMSGAKISGVTMTGNSLTATSGNIFYGGGAIYVGSGRTLELTDSNIYNNTSKYDSKIPSCDISVHSKGTLTQTGITANDGDDTTTEQCLVYKPSTLYYVEADGKTLAKK